MQNANASENIAVLGTIDPDAYSTSTVVSDYVDMSDFESVLIVLQAGTIVSTGTIDAVVKQATDSSGSGAKNLTTTKAITQLTEAGTDSDKQVVLEVRAEELDVNNVFTHVAISVTFATAGADFGAVLLGINPSYGPASANDLGSVDEIVT